MCTPPYSTPFYSTGRGFATEPNLAQLDEGYRRVVEVPKVGWLGHCTCYKQDTSDRLRPKDKVCRFETLPIEGSDHGVLGQKGETSPFATFVQENGMEFKDRISHETFKLSMVAVFAQEATTWNEFM